jgi:glycosyltransferase involved in cell wall biosynthesis
MRVALVTNVSTHYRRPLFDELAGRVELDVFLTSQGREWYTLREYRAGEFEHVTGPGLVRALARGGYDVILANLAGRVAPLASYAVARLLRKRFVLWVGIWSHPGGFAHRLSRPLARHLYRHADAVVCYGPHVAGFVREESGRVDGVVCTRQAVEDARFRRRVSAGRLASLRTELGVGAAPLVTYVGRFEEDKGLDHLLRASALATHDHRLLLIGKGPLEAELRALAAELGIADRVRFPGYVCQDELPAHLQASDVVVLPSVTTPRFREPWGLILNEGMAAGVAVVATTAVGAAAGGLVLDGRTGLVVRERNATELARAIDRLLDNKAFRLELARRGSEHVRAWSFEAAADVFEDAVTGLRRRESQVAA